MSAVSCGVLHELQLWQLDVLIHFQWKLSVPLEYQVIRRMGY